MKVICILPSEWGSEMTNSKANGPSFGEICTAKQCAVHDDSYDIAEYPFNEDGRPQSFVKKCFAPVSDIDETEFVREYNKELV